MRKVKTELKEVLPLGVGELSEESVGRSEGKMQMFHITLCIFIAVVLCLSLFILKSLNLSDFFHGKKVMNFISLIITTVAIIISQSIFRPKIKRLESSDFMTKNTLRKLWFLNIGNWAILSMTILLGLIFYLTSVSGSIIMIVCILILILIYFQKPDLIHFEEE